MCKNIKGLYDCNHFFHDCVSILFSFLFECEDRVSGLTRTGDKYWTIDKTCFYSTVLLDTILTLYKRCPKYGKHIWSFISYKICNIDRLKSFFSVFPGVIRSLRLWKKDLTPKPLVQGARCPWCCATHRSRCEQHNCVIITVLRFHVKTLNMIKTQMKVKHFLLWCLCGTCKCTWCHFEWWHQTQTDSDDRQ